jgi:tRNA A-37 threonylcarbamoyl transferase component Bud32
MSVLEIATSTIIWVKGFTTSFYRKINAKLISIKFVKRNKKLLFFCMIIWLAICITGYFIYRDAKRRLNNKIYAHGITKVQDLASKVGLSILENDTLALSIVVREIISRSEIEFAAIIDHQDKVIAHTQPERINSVFLPPENLRFVETVEDISIEEGYADHNRIIGFKCDIRYAGVRIGGLYVALNATSVDTRMKRYALLLLVFVAASFLVLSVIVGWADLRAKAKRLQGHKELDAMSRIGPYVLEKKIAQGGMAEVYLADYVREDGFRRTVAVKRVLPHLAENQDFIRMFVREARLAAILQHPNIVQIFDFGKITNNYFIAMEYIRGKTLAEIMANVKGGLPVDMAVFVILQVCRGLEYSHSKTDDKTGEPLRIVHRDISPQNILISFRGEVKISDFGISKARSEPSLTQAGVIKGKLSYLAPEQALGKGADQQSDIYSLGVVFYEILSGQRVYRFKTEIEAIRLIPTLEIAPIVTVRPEVPDELNRIVMKCLEKDKRLRYQSAQSFHDDLMNLKSKLNMGFDTLDLSRFIQTLFKPQQAS